MWVWLGLRVGAGCDRGYLRLKGVMVVVRVRAGIRG